MQPRSYNQLENRTPRETLEWKEDSGDDDGMDELRKEIRLGSGLEEHQSIFDHEPQRPTESAPYSSKAKQKGRNVAASELLTGPYPRYHEVEHPVCVESVPASQLCLPAEPKLDEEGNLIDDDAELRSGIGWLPPKRVKTIFARDLFGHGRTPWRPYISFDEFVRAHSAVEFANTLGTLMNVELTIAPKSCGFETVSEVDYFSKTFFKKYRNMCAKWHFDPRHITVFENSKHFGLHFHSMLAVPPDKLVQFENWISPAVQRLGLGGHWMPRVLYFRVRAAPTVKSQWRWFNYIFKGLDPACKTPKGYDFASVASIMRLQAPGDWSLKRVRISESLSCGRQKKLRFLNITQRCDWEEAEWNSDECYRSRQVFHDYSGASVGKSRKRKPFVPRHPLMLSARDIAGLFQNFAPSKNSRMLTQQATDL